MKKILPLSLLASVLLGATALLPAHAQAQQMNYQGRLTDTNGNALLDGQYTLTFNLYDAAAGGAAVWGPFICDSIAGDGHAAKADLVSGRFNVIIGPLDTAGRSLAPAFTGGVPRYLGITVGTGAQISPRQQILAAPEALHAQLADTVPNGAIGTDQIADGSITAAKISGGTGVWVGNGQNIYRDAGNVGIGTPSPIAKLDVSVPTGSSALQISGTGAGAQNWGLYPSTNQSLVLQRPGLRLAVFGNDGSAYLGGTSGDSGEAANLTVKGGSGGNVGIGTTDPAAKLDVRGDVKLGPAGQYFAPAGEENLRIVRGWGTADVTVGETNPSLYGRGYTYKKIGTGLVEVIYDTPFNGTPCVTANPTKEGAIFCVLRGVNGNGLPDRTGFQIIMYDTANHGRDWPFNFIAIGPR